MAPFAPPAVVLSGFQERIESLTLQGDRLYVGTGTGSIHVYALGGRSDASGDEGRAELVDVKKALSRRAIDQLSYVQDINSLAVLSDTLVTLYPLPDFTPPTPLVKTKGALSFAVFTSVEHERVGQNDLEGELAKASEVPVVVTYLAVGSKRKMLLYSWKDGEPQEVQEAVLPHSPRGMAFLNSETICFGYSPTEYSLFSLKSKVTTDIVPPLNAAVSAASIGSVGKGAISGLSGYMTLGFGAKAKPCVINVGEDEVLIAKDNTGIFIGEEGKVSRPVSIEWPAPPEETAFVKPYVFSIMPPGTVPVSQIQGDSVTTASSLAFVPSAVVEIRSSVSLVPAQMLPLPFAPVSPGAPPAAANHVVRLMTASPSSRSPLYVVTTPIDRATATAEGTTVWQIQMKPWGEQVDELVEAGSYADALALLDSIDSAILPDKDRRQQLVRALNAVAQFRSADFKAAVDAFIELNINPAKVVALYPESVAGRLSTPQDEWIHLFGGPQKPIKSETSSSHSKPSEEGQADAAANVDSPPRPPSPQGSVRGLLRTGLGSIIATARREDDTSSIHSGRKVPPKDDLRRSLEELMRYLSDRRPKVRGALEALNITAGQSHQMPRLSSASTEDLFSLPNAPLTSLTPEELVRFSQIVDTALFKSYLIVRPGLLASLCRVENWCEVSEVEEVLHAREKFSELIYLYNGKKMHGKALDLLRQLSEKETEMRDKLMPSVNYLQRLGPEHLDQIFESSRWVYEQDADIAFEIFTSEEVELPRQPVADFLERLDPAISARYVEYLIDERGEVSPLFHDRLAELYLRMTINAKKKGLEDKRQALYSKLLQFIDTTQHYRTDRLFGLLPDDFYEAKAILLGRLGRHEHALEIYVYRLQDFQKAEEYCKRIYQPDTETRNVFLSLLRIYLRPTVQTSFDLLRPALDLISRHSPRLDAVETLQILPPLVTAQDVRAFLVESLRAPVFDRKVVREISKARDEQVARKLAHLQARRVKITDSRICPQCHKRIGHSVIAVHAPRGEVTHYQCREAFSRKLKEIRS